jgi:hypothetical protein
MKVSSLVRCLHLILYFVLFNQLTAKAQTEAYYSKPDKNESGYWLLKTDVEFYGTRIQFYSADSQLVYQEALPNRFIVLNSKNIRRLDQTLARLLDNQLVVSSVFTSKLPFEPAIRRSNRKSTELLTKDSNHSAETSFNARFLTPLNQSKIHLLLDNPMSERLTISIVSSDNTPVYQHITHLETSRHHLNFDGMPSGTYQIWVKSATQQMHRPVVLNYGQDRVTLHIKEPFPASKYITLSK